jgi:hypothetical protein
VPDAAILVVEVDLHFRADAEDAGAKDARRGLAHLAGEDGGHLGGAADADVVGGQRLEEGACAAGVVEDDGAGDLDLAERQFPSVASLPIPLAEGRRDDSQPAVNEGLMSRGERASQIAWRRSGSLQTGEAVGELPVGNRCSSRLALGPLVAVEPDLGWVGGSSCRA